MTWDKYGNSTLILPAAHRFSVRKTVTDQLRFVAINAEFLS
jgi:hypothetical protein